MDGVSPELLEFAVSALNHATESVIDSGGPMTPFSLVEGGREGQKGQLTRFVTETLEEGLIRARAKVRESTGLHRAVVAWDGYLTLDGARTDAVFVEAFEAGDSESIILAQRYVVGDGDTEVVRRTGDIALAGRGEPLF